MTLKKMKQDNLKEVTKDVVKSCYIHIPFCQKICTYCDFCKMYYNEKLVKSYLNELEKEVNEFYQGEMLETLYIGGGTPSSLKNDELKKLFEITNSLNLSENAEFTFECNIENINENLLKILKEGKVNRLSIGVESFNKKLLSILGRNYNFSVTKKIKLAKKYFNNINIDLIYGINGETIAMLKKDLKKFLDLDINHISIYSLILENNTVLKVKNYQEIDDDLSRDMYDLIVKTLKEHGYNHYEISNFSKDGFESRHNLTYWNNQKYYGFGLNASGYINNIRYTNTRSLTNYLKGSYKKDEEIITKKIDMENFMILGLRKIKGVEKNDFKKRYNKEIKDIFDVSKLKETEKNFYIAEDDLYISNYILKDFIE